MNKDLGVWTSGDRALVLIDYWYFTEVARCTDAVGVAEAEKLAAQGAH